MFGIECVQTKHCLESGKEKQQTNEDDAVIFMVLRRLGSAG